MSTAHHSKIRFISYAIPTGPELSAVGTGVYLGNPNTAKDMAARIAILKHAVDTAKAQLPAGESSKQVINLFMAPEFFFHGTQGPYIYATDNEDPLPKLLSDLALVFNSNHYPNWTFIFGTAVTAQVANIDNVFASESVIARNAIVATLAQQLQNASGATYQLISNTLRDFIDDCQDAPNLIVRDRALIVSNILLDTPISDLQTNLMMTEKYNLSEEDFILCAAPGTTNVVTEQMVGYDRIDLSNGDIKHSAFDKYAIFRQNYGKHNFPQFVDFAVEICLDHDDARLRNNLGLEPFPSKGNAVHVQLIPSYGSQIVQENVVADQFGFVFNCDGQTALDASSVPQQGDLYGVQSVYASYSDGAYAAHSQLARVQTAAHGNDPNNNSASFEVLSAADVKVITLNPPTLVEGIFAHYFAGGPGAIHIFGLNQPYTMYPTQC